MLQLTLSRFDMTDDCTIGKLSIDGEFLCYTLEDRVREVQGQDVLTWKIPGVTAIPRGNYRILKTYSNRFEREMLQLVGVPGFVGVRVHAGSYAKNTEGCILVGLTAGNEMVSRSKEAVRMIEDELSPVLIRNADVFVKIT
jgi:hypothetical protein